MSARVLDAFGSFQVVGPVWSSINARGPLRERQINAQAQGVCCYVEQHLNAVVDPKVNYSMAILPDTAPPLARAWAKAYTKAIAAEFGIRDGGIVLGVRGAANVHRLRCPAMLTEPLFVSNPDSNAQTDEAQSALARVLVKSITDYFSPGIVGLSVGHLYRGNADKGANVAHDPGELLDPAFDQEGEICDSIVNKAQELFRAIR